MEPRPLGLFFCWMSAASYFLVNFLKRILSRSEVSCLSNYVVRVLSLPDGLLFTLCYGRHVVGVVSRIGSWARGLFSGESVVACFIRRRILSKKGEETFCLGEKIQTSFSEASMKSCVINDEFTLFPFFPPSWSWSHSSCFQLSSGFRPGPSGWLQ